MEKIEFSFSEQEIIGICRKLNILLEKTSLVLLSRFEVEVADPQKRIYGTGRNQYSNIVKIINRWGIKEKDGKYYELLNDVICEISIRHRMLQIYEPIQLLLFNKLLEGWSKGINTKFNKEEIEIFFVQPFRMITSSCIPESSVYLYDLIRASHYLSPKLKSEDAKEFLDQGIGRRLFMLKVSTDNISKIYSSHRVKNLDEEENAILSQNINFFYSNIYAILDCLAFVLAFESPTFDVDRNNKKGFNKVNLFKSGFYKNINGLNEKLNLARLTPWYKEIISLRHPEAHRIPLYFPEIYKEDDVNKIREINDEYSTKFDDILRKMMKLSSVENEQILKKMNRSNKLNESMNRLREEKQKLESNIKVFSGCFYHSEEESNKFYHLSRLTLDLGILYYILDHAFEYILA